MLCLCVVIFLFWERFYSLCVENKTTPTKVVKAIGVSHGATTKWKNGTNPNADVLVKLAEYFNVSIDYIMGLTDSKNEILRRVDFDHLEQYDDNGRVVASFKEVVGTEEDFEAFIEFLKQKGMKYYVSDKKNEATPEEQPISPKQKLLLDISADMTDEDIKKLIEYADLLNLRRNQ